MIDRIDLLRTPLKLLRNETPHVPKAPRTARPKAPVVADKGALQLELFSEQSHEAPATPPLPAAGTAMGAAAGIGTKTRVGATTGTTAVSTRLSTIKYGTTTTTTATTVTT